MFKYDDDVLDMICNYWRENFTPPPMRTIMKKCGVKSLSHVSNILKRLERENKIEIHGNAKPVPLFVVRAISGE